MSESPTHAGERRALLMQLRRVFEQNGYAGATFSLMAAATGLGRATLYHYFPGGKQEMAEALLEDAAAELDTRAFSQLLGGARPTDRLAAFLQGFGEYLHDGHGHCLLAVFAQGDARDLLGPAVARHMARWQMLLEATLSSTGLSPKRARRAAEEGLDGLYGGLVVGKMTGDERHFERALKRTARRLEKLD